MLNSLGASTFGIELILTQLANLIIQQLLRSVRFVQVWFVRLVSYFWIRIDWSCVVIDSVLIRRVSYKLLFELHFVLFQNQGILSWIYVIFRRIRPFHRFQIYLVIAYIWHFVWICIIVWGESLIAWRSVSIVRGHGYTVEFSVFIWLGSFENVWLVYRTSS